MPEHVSHHSLPPEISHALIRRSSPALDRFHAVLSGERIDRPLVAAWGHFVDAERDPRELARRTAEFTRSYDWDWVKINPRSTFYAEGWGNLYDYRDYHGAQPRQVRGAINRLRDVWEIEPFPVQSTPAWQDHVQLTRLLRAALPELPLAVTVFSPLTILLNLAGQPRQAYSPIPGSRSRATLHRLISEEGPGTLKALGAITAVLNDFVARSAEAGADALYYALTGTAHDAITTAEEFDTFSRPFDLAVVDAARQNGLKVILHTCGSHSHPERFSSWPVDAVSWDHLAPGNPDLDPANPVIPVGGIAKELIAAGDAVAVRQQAATAISRFADSALLLAPTCAVDTSLDNPALFALREAVEQTSAAA